MEEKVFPAPAVAGKMEQMIEARIHNDARETQDVVRAMQAEMINTYATPSYALIDPDSGELLASHPGPEFSAEAFGKWLDSALGKWEAR